MADRGIRIDVFQVGLYNSRISTVNHTDTRQDNEYPRKLFSCFGHKANGHPETTVASQFHQHAGVKHRHRCGR